MAADLEDGRSLREDIGSFLGIRRPTTGPEVRTLASWQDDGYVRHLVHLVTDDDTIPALLAVPPGVGPFPGVVVLHQHAGQRHLGKSEVFGLAGDPYQAFGPALARAGFVVVAPDSIAFEDRRPAGPGTDPRDDDGDQHYNALTYRLVAGDTLMRKVIEDTMAAVSVLVDRPDVNTNAVAALGHSYGGNTTLFLTALDERVRFGCASGALASYRRKMADGTGIEMAEVIPGFRTRFDLDHVLAAIAPRPFLVASATEDRYSADADELVDLARPAFRTAPRSLTHRRAEGGHALDRERFQSIIDWMIEHAAASR